jgi:flagellar assembly factor FliW
MQIESPRFGTLEIEPSRIIEFPRGLLGFEDCRRFTLFHPEGEAPTYFILQSIDDPALAFHVADPGQFGFNHEINLSDEESTEIKFDGSDEALANMAVVVLLNKESKDMPLRANVKAPLIINLEARLGLQHVFTKLDFTVAQEPATA